MIAQILSAQQAPSPREVELVAAQWAVTAEVKDPTRLRLLTVELKNIGTTTQDSWLAGARWEWFLQARDASNREIPLRGNWGPVGGFGGSVFGKSIDAGKADIQVIDLSECFILPTQGEITVEAIHYTKFNQSWFGERGFPENVAKSLRSGWIKVNLGQ